MRHPLDRRLATAALAYRSGCAALAVPLWKRSRKSPPNESPGVPATEQAVLIRITPLRDADSGLDRIEAPIIAAIERSGIGEFDGNDVGPDGATLYLYGQDADAIWAEIDEVVDRTALRPGSHALVRYGATDVSDETHRSRLTE